MNYPDFLGIHFLGRLHSPNRIIQNSLEPNFQEFVVPKSNYLEFPGTALWGFGFPKSNYLEFSGTRFLGFGVPDLNYPEFPRAPFFGIWRIPKNYISGNMFGFWGDCSFGIEMS